MPSKGHWEYLFYHLFWTGLDWLYPPNCGGCGKRGFKWCPDCQSNVKLLEDNLCPCCGQSSFNGSICYNCRQHPPVYRAARSWAVFEGPVQQALHRLKYDRDVGLGDSLAQFMIDLFNKLDWPVDIVAPVPLSSTRMKERGYNQASFLAKPLALSLGLQYKPDAIQKVRNTRSQVELTAAERRENVKGAFLAKKEIVKDCSILIVDDVMTSGATLNSCANALLDAHAKQVYCLTFARALNPQGDGRK